MKKAASLLVLILVLAGAGFYVYFRSGIAFGISSQSPLGTLGKVERHLLKIGLEKDAAKLNELSKLVLGQQVLYYVDRDSMDGKDYTDYVTIIADQEGDVQKFRAQFDSGLSRAKIRMMTRLYWTSAGGDLDFRPGEDGLLVKEKDAEIAEFSTSRIEGRWVRRKDAEKVEVDYK